MATRRDTRSSGGGRAAARAGRQDQSAPVDRSLTDLFSELEKGDINATQPPSVKLLEWFHRNVSTERDADIHHKIGSQPGDVARGTHTHDGKDSYPLWASADIPANPSATTASLASWAATVGNLLRAKSG